MGWCCPLLTHILVGNLVSHAMNAKEAIQTQPMVDESNPQVHLESVAPPVSINVSAPKLSVQVVYLIQSSVLPSPHEIAFGLHGPGGHCRLNCASPSPTAVDVGYFCSDGGVDGIACQKDQVRTQKKSQSQVLTKQVLHRFLDCRDCFIHVD